MPLFTALLLPLIFGCPLCQSSREMWQQRKCLFPSKQRIFSVHRERQRKTKTMTQHWYLDVKPQLVSVLSNCSSKNYISVIIYLPSWHSKPVLICLLQTTKGEILMLFSMQLHLMATATFQASKKGAKMIHMIHSLYSKSLKLNDCFVWGKRQICYLLIISPSTKLLTTVVG